MYYRVTTRRRLLEQITSHKYETKGFQPILKIYDYTIRYSKTGKQIYTFGNCTHIEFDMLRLEVHDRYMIFSNLTWQ